MRISFALLLFFITNFLHGQITLQGTVIDSTTNEPIGYVNIGVLEKNNGTVSSEKGEFILKAKEGRAEVRFSSIGYQSKTFSVKELRARKKVFLKPIAYEIEPININAKKFRKNKKIGTRVLAKIHTVTWGNPNGLGVEIGLPIAIKKETLIKSVHFGVLKRSKMSALLRINIYEFSNGKIGKNIMPKNVFVQAHDLIHYSGVDLSDLHLLVEDDILITIESIEKKDVQKGEKFHLVFGAGLRRKGNIYYRFASQADFQRDKVRMLIIGGFIKGKQVR